MYIVEDTQGETYAVLLDELKLSWLVIRRRADQQTGQSPLVGHSKTLAGAFDHLAKILQQ